MSLSPSFPFAASHGASSAARGMPCIIANDSPEMHFRFRASQWGTNALGAMMVGLPMVLGWQAPVGPAPMSSTALAMPVRTLPAPVGPVRTVEIDGQPVMRPLGIIREGGAAMEAPAGETHRAVKITVEPLPPQDIGNGEGFVAPQRKDGMPVVAAAPERKAPARKVARVGAPRRAHGVAELFIHPLGR